MSTSRKPNYTLAGTPEWRETQRMKPIHEFTSGEKAFIKKSLTSEREDHVTGTRFQFIEPEPAERRLSMISFDIDDETEQTDQFDVPETGLQATPRRPGKFKRVAKKLYPAKVVGGAKAIGGAVRHPMVAGRKVNRFVRRKSNNGQDPSGPISDRRQSLAEGLPPMARSMTITIGEQGPTQSSVSSPTRGLRKGVLRRRNSAPTISKNLDQKHDLGAAESTVKDHVDGSHVCDEAEYDISSNSSPERANSDAGLSISVPLMFSGFTFPSVPNDREDKLPEGDDGASTLEALEDISSEIQDQIDELTLSGSVRDSKDTISTIPLCPIWSSSQKSVVSAENFSSRGSRRFNAAELAYLNFVIDRLYHLILDSALEKSGVQYRNTFAWKFHTEKLNEFDRAIGHQFLGNGKKFKIKDFLGEFDFGSALLDILSQEPKHKELGLSWSEVSFVDRRMKIELSYTLTDEESE